MPDHIKGCQRPDEFRPLPGLRPCRIGQGGHALLDFCGLPFDQRCLRFFENERAVRTASSEQVRRPIYREGLDQWRHFEPWLDPLKQALGPVLDHYPAVPPAGELPV